MFLFGNLSAQAPYTLHISGQLEGCTPGQQVTVQTLPGTLPAQMATAAVATDCSFSATFGMDSPSGGVLAFFHCGNGTVTADSSAYAISGPSGSTDIMLQLTCGSDTSSACQACFTVTQSAPFTAQFTSCTTGGTPPYFDGWLLPDGSLSIGPAPSFIFSGPGAYGVCLQSSDATGATSVACDTVIVAADGTINPPGSLPCLAGFWMVQAYSDTSNGGNFLAPVPNEVWVLDLSSASGGINEYTWDFGDGSSSSETYPTHEYQGPGPYQLCLTISNGSCSDTFCDTVSVDESGLLNGMATDPGTHVTTAHVSDRDGGFTLNVLQGFPTSVAEVSALAEFNLWPNPAQEELNITFKSSHTGAVSVTVIDLNGRTMLREDHPLALGNNAVRLNTASLAPGLYMVRLGDAAQQVAQRFLKVR
jgi:PKD repeat protein